MSESNQTATETAALELRKAIIRGDLKTGDRLIPAKLEKEMGLNRISIREAIRELVGVGLVESATHKGAFIAEPLDISELKEIFEVRYQLEGKAAFLGAQKISEADIIRMDLILDKIETSDNPYDGFFLNQEFHMILYRATGWRYLIKTIDRMFDQILAFRSNLYHRLVSVTIADEFDQSYLERYLKSHRQIVELLNARNSEKVRDLTVSHTKSLGFNGIYQIYKQVVIKESKEIIT